MGATEAEIRGMRKELQRLPVLEGIYGTNDRGDAWWTTETWDGAIRHEHSHSNVLSLIYTPQEMSLSQIFCKNRFRDIFLSHNRYSFAKMTSSSPTLSCTSKLISSHSHPISSYRTYINESPFPTKTWCKFMRARGTKTTKGESTCWFLLESRS